MDKHTFDDMVRALSEPGSRRHVLRLLVGGALGALTGSLAADTPSKAKKRKKKGCPAKPCPSGSQRNKRTCKCECVRTPCSGGMEFDLDECRCKCPRDLRECRDGCVGKDACCPSDPPCPEDPKGCCHSPGVEVCTIDGCCREFDGKKACNDFCVDTNTHPIHCGDCNSSCGPGEECVAGSCEPNGCPDDRFHCPGNTGPFCAPAGHTCCGDASCDSSQVCCDPSQSLCCARGRCADEQCCPGATKACDGKCVDTQTDRNHCGRCGFWCGVPGFDCCGGSCTNLQSDEENCGACGNACDARTQTCVEGQCRDICSLNQPPWQNRCDDGVDYWCCPDGSTTCCRLSGAPHCC